jgi:peroxiredoxin
MKYSTIALSSAFALTVGLAAFATSRADSNAPLAATQEGKKDEPKKDDVKKDDVKKDAVTKATIGKAAPDFTLTDLDGKTVKLSDYKGKVVVLEWFNPECPFVIAAYSGPLKEMAANAKKDGVVWLSINSGAAGQQGNGAEKNKKAREDWKMASTILLDEKGDVGRLYEAKSTPHCFVIDSKGVLVYRGALDNAPAGKTETEGAKKIDYLANALADVKAGKPVATPETKSWGCSVKYAKTGP